MAGAVCGSIPASKIIFKNGSALPSAIGGSGPSISIRALSTLQADSAAKTCSTVDTAAPSLFAIVVPRLTSTTLDAIALTEGFPATSTLRKMIPVFSPDGLIVK